MIEKKNPSISFELHDDMVVHVKVSWGDEEDLERFAYMLLSLQQGGLAGPINGAVNVEAGRHQIPHIGAEIQNFLTGELSPSNRPVVPPREVVSRHLKLSGLIGIGGHHED